MPVFFEYLYTFSEEKNSRNDQAKGKAQAAIPSCFKGKALGMTEGSFLLLVRLGEMWHLRAPWHLCAEIVAERHHPANNMTPLPEYS